MPAVKAACLKAQHPLFMPFVISLSKGSGKEPERNKRCPLRKKTVIANRKCDHIAKKMLLYNNFMSNKLFL